MYIKVVIVVSTKQAALVKLFFKVYQLLGNL